MRKFSSIYLTLALSMVTIPFVSDAAKPKAKPRKPATPAVTFEQVKSLFDTYRFDEAQEKLDAYVDRRGTPLGEEVNIGDGENAEDNAEVLAKQIVVGRAMLDRVEKLVVIDSLIVDADDFFKAYRLSPQSGSLQDASAVTDVISADALDGYTPVGPVYISEEQDYMMWAGKANEYGRPMVMFESDLLSDGKWSTPQRLFEQYPSLNLDETFSGIASPFLMSDGVTLYYAAGGEQSLGGLDIFISRRDGDGFLQPTNIGMPYNSPYDDYMLAIDEVTGVGWWATDRNRIPGKVTIYRFIPSELRVNYPPDMEGLIDYAKLASVNATHTSDAPIPARLKALKALDSPTDEKVSDFELALPGNVIYTSFDDFRSNEARRYMEQYMQAVDAREADMQDLRELREAYRNGDRSGESRIKEIEKRVETSYEDLTKRLNLVITTELHSR